MKEVRGKKMKKESKKKKKNNKAILTEYESSEMGRKWNNKNFAIHFSHSFWLSYFYCCCCCCSWLFFVCVLLLIHSILVCTLCNIFFDCFSFSHDDVRNTDFGCDCFEYQRLQIALRITLLLRPLIWFQYVRVCTVCTEVHWCTPARSLARPIWNMPIENDSQIYGPFG